MEPATKADRPMTPQHTGDAGMSDFLVWPRLPLTLSSSAPGTRAVDTHPFTSKKQGGPAF